MCRKLGINWLSTLLPHSWSFLYHAHVQTILSCPSDVVLLLQDSHLAICLCDTLAQLFLVARRKCATQSMEVCAFPHSGTQEQTFSRNSNLRSLQTTSLKDLFYLLLILFWNGHRKAVSKAFEKDGLSEHLLHLRSILLTNNTWIIKQTNKKIYLSMNRDN